MSSQDEASRLNQGINDFYLPDQAQINNLRTIIRSESGFKFTYKDAEEVGLQLITLYECLAKGKPILPAGTDHESRE